MPKLTIRVESDYDQHYGSRGWQDVLYADDEVVYRGAVVTTQESAELAANKKRMQLGIDRTFVVTYGLADGSTQTGMLSGYDNLMAASARANKDAPKNATSIKVEDAT